MSSTSKESPRHILHLVTHPEDVLAPVIIGEQQRNAALQVEVVELSGPVEADYRALVEKIFAADSVQVW